MADSKLYLGKSPHVLCDVATLYQPIAADIIDRLDSQQDSRPVSLPKITSGQQYCGTVAWTGLAGISILPIWGPGSLFQIGEPEVPPSTPKLPVAT